MRYGNPSIDSALEKLEGCSDITVIPFISAYSSAATGSAVEKLLGPVARLWNIPEVKIIRDFYNHPGFITAYAERIKKSITGKKIDLILFSYHGLPDDI